MAEESPQKPKRRLKPAVTMRERAERTSAQSNKPKRLRRVTRPVGAPFRATSKGLRRISNIRILKPFKVALRFVGRIIFPKFFRDSFRELRLVTWPGRRQTWALTGAVIAFSVVFGLFIAAFDYGLDKLFKQVLIK